MLRRAMYSVAIVATSMVCFADLATAQHQFRARCTGDQEVPPVETDAVSFARIKLFLFGDRPVMVTTRIDFGLSSPFRAAHIHVAPVGQNGPAVVTYDPPIIEVRGFAFSFDIHTATDSGDPLGGLIETMRAGNTYINVHTEEHSPGEVRGQIQGRDR